MIPFQLTYGTAHLNVRATTVDRAFIDPLNERSAIHRTVAFSFFMLSLMNLPDLISILLLA